MGKEYGAAPLLIYLRALNMSNMGRLLEAKATLVELENFGNSYWLYQVLSFKVNVLARHVDTQIDEKYQKITVLAGKGESAILEISEEDLEASCLEREDEESDLCVIWEWLCESYDISFTAFFRPSDGSDISIVQNVDRHEAHDGPVAGRFFPNQPGTIQLEWDNRYSFLRQKVINYRLSCTLRLREN